MQPLAAHSLHQEFFKRVVARFGLRCQFPQCKCGARAEGLAPDGVITMLNWLVGTETDFAVSTGKSGKYLKNYLPPQTWQKLLATYPSGEEAALWQALFTMMDLFEETAQEVAARLHFTYDRSFSRS